MGERLGGGLRQRVRIDEDRRLDSVAAQPHALGEVGHRERVRSVAEENGPHLRGAIPIAIRLDDPEQLAPGADQRPYRPHVVGGGVEVDRERVRTQGKGRHRGVMIPRVRAMMGAAYDTGAPAVNGRCQRGS
jgi:hypothetical protein